MREENLYLFAQPETPSGALVPITLLRERAAAIRTKKLVKQ